MNFQISITYFTKGKLAQAKASNSDFDLIVDSTDNHYKVTLVPKAEVIIASFEAKCDYNYANGAKFFANGFQSWTDTKEFCKNEKMGDAGILAKTPIGNYLGLKYVGDYTFAKQAKTAGEFHAHGFAYVRNGDEYHLFGSLNDATGYTIIYADMNSNTLKFTKDLEGITISQPYEIMNLYIAKGDYDSVFNGYFDAMGVKPLTDKKLRGYTSWYNYYQNISQDIILRDLDSICQQKDYINVFQIDDGYQTAVGDWLSIDSKKFPNGMKYVADAIRNKGLKAGLWLAPFGAQRSSQLVKQHPDWLVCDKKGKPICVGPNWGGFYPINIYHPEAREYIKKVFNTVVNEWGFDMVKLDFIYAAAIVPLNNKTRGEIAYDAIDLLRECVGEKDILGCGVQMLPCFGKTQYMRIGADMNLGWQPTFLQRLTHREDVSTPNAIHNSIYRRMLNGRAFLCDPDVFLLRRTNIRFSFEQQKLIAKIIKLFGSILFMSDNLADYNSIQLDVFKDTLTDDATVDFIDETDDVITISYTQSNANHTIKFNISNGEILSNN